MDGYWITESVTWKIYAESEAEARAIWLRYVETGESEGLDMKCKDMEIEADWEWQVGK